LAATARNPPQTPWVMRLFFFVETPPTPRRPKIPKRKNVDCPTCVISNTPQPLIPALRVSRVIYFVLSPLHHHTSTSHNPESPIPPFLSIHSFTPPLRATTHTGWNSVFHSPLFTPPKPPQHRDGLFMCFEFPLNSPLASPVLSPLPPPRQDFFSPICC